MNKKQHLDYTIAFRQLHGHYPPHIYRHHLNGGDFWNDLKNGLTDFGKGFTSVFQTIGNFINDHADIFAQVAVTASLMLLFPELAPEIAIASSQELLQKVVATKPADAPTPSQADIDKALADYKKDPRYKLMLQPMKTCVGNITKYCFTPGANGNYAPISYKIASAPDYSINAYGAMLWPLADDATGDIQLNLKLNDVVICFPIDIIVTDALNYKLTISCPHTGVVLNADASNWLDLLYPDADAIRNGQDKAQRYLENAPQRAIDEARQKSIQDAITKLNNMTPEERAKYNADTAAEDEANKNATQNQQNAIDKGMADLYKKSADNQVNINTIMDNAGANLYKTKADAEADLQWALAHSNNPTDIQDDRLYNRVLAFYNKWDAYPYRPLGTLVSGTYNTDTPAPVAPAQADLTAPGAISRQSIGDQAKIDGINKKLRSNGYIFHPADGYTDTKWIIDNGYTGPLQSDKDWYNAKLAGFKTPSGSGIKRRYKKMGKK
jgi:hypothetical protein